jgi:probable F420-dependent oxidoreductase
VRQISSPRPLRTAVYAPPLGTDLGRWRGQLAAIDAAGFTAVTVSDHFSYGSMDPVAGLAAIAGATSRVRLMALVFCNDYRHPVLLHKAAATVDVLSAGRLDLGMGAGFLAAEYAAAGLPYDQPAVRIARLDEALDVVQALFTGDRVRHAGQYYTVKLAGLPAPVQRPHPPLVIGGGGKRMLTLAGRRASIVGIHSNLSRGTAYDAGVIEDMLPERMQAKIGWARAAAQDAGRDPDALDYLYISWATSVVDSPRATRPALQAVAQRFGVDVAVARRSLGLLVGTADECYEQLMERRDRYGLNYPDFGVTDLDALAPLMERIAAAEATPAPGQRTTAG